MPMSRLVQRWLLVGTNEPKPPRRPGTVAPGVGDLVRLNGQSITKHEFAPFGGCAGRIDSIDEKKQTFDFVYVALLGGQRETGLSLEQLVSLSLFDETMYKAAEQAKTEKRRAQAKQSRIKKKEKEHANKEWDKQFKEPKATALTPRAPTPPPQHLPSGPDGDDEPK